MQFVVFLAHALTSSDDSNNTQRKLIHADERSGSTVPISVLQSSGANKATWVQANGRAHAPLVLGWDPCRYRHCLHPSDRVACASYGSHLFSAPHRISIDGSGDGL